MLFMKGHGGHAIYEYDEYDLGTKRLVQDASGYGTDEEYPGWDPGKLDQFGYLCDGAAGIPAPDKTVAALREIACKMSIRPRRAMINSKFLRPLLTSVNLSITTLRHVPIAKSRSPKLTIPISSRSCRARPRTMWRTCVQIVWTLDNLHGGTVLQGNFCVQNRC